MLELKDVYLEHGGRVILDHVNLALADGENLCVVGAAGSGKTSVLLALQGLLPIKGGFLTLDGERYSRLSAPYFRRWMAFVPDAPQLPYEKVSDLLEELFSLAVNRDVEVSKEAVIREFSLLGLAPDVYNMPLRNLDAETLQGVMLAAEGILKRRILLIDNLRSTRWMDSIAALNSHQVSAVITTCDEQVAANFDKIIRL
ncbi:ATP-binding cassette domain-containing protein [Prevotella sp. KH2C16]|uniref:ATP-binding cassette domain-containing protein n=1 Tax=Prevotella sp. KH2C16 TaxID=1855325 RepID=UPI0008F44975|nr:ATP-binding cassette domain-containing protein [Prevotella sp. KH2C16]SFG16885.1 ABC-type cobalamin/Fe3+-siderophores transport system, ATPase component [Prevotella sp. KH2C16]